ncbi:MAG TPA: hypothetical protein ENJ95_05620 [Bacteroidetes bacterium]|nr:hypothetical protein [Bacteroidota bacterium]
MIVQGQTERALHVLTKAVRNHERYEEQVTLLSGQFSKLKDNRRMNLVLEENYSVSLNRINQSVLSIARDLEMELRKHSFKDTRSWASSTRQFFTSTFQHLDLDKKRMNDNMPIWFLAVAGAVFIVSLVIILSSQVGNNVSGEPSVEGVSEVRPPNKPENEIRHEEILPNVNEQNNGSNKTPPYVSPRTDESEKTDKPSQVVGTNKKCILSGRVFTKNIGTRSGAEVELVGSDKKCSTDGVGNFRLDVSSIPRRAEYSLKIIKGRRTYAKAKCNVPVQIKL